MRLKLLSAFLAFLCYNIDKAMKKYLAIFAVGLAVVAAGYFWLGQKTDKKNIPAELEKQGQLENGESKAIETETAPEIAEPKQTQEIPKENVYKKIKQSVPFVVQAPFGKWKDQDFQNGCEEAAMIMAMGWTDKIAEISTEESETQIKDIIKFEEKSLGYSADTDIFDMQKIFQKYFEYNGAEARENIKIDDIKNELQKGNIVLVPAFGRALKNPNYTSPGPITHMLVIIGYDPERQKFITNDSGTRKGRDYEYAENILFGAIWQYPSGKKHPEPPKGTLKKGMLVIKSL